MLVVHQLAFVVVGIGLEVQVAMAAQVEEDGLLLAFLFAEQRLIDGGPDRMGAFGRRE